MCMCLFVCRYRHYTYMKEVFEDKPAAGVLVMQIHVYVGFGVYIHILYICEGRF